MKATQARILLTGAGGGIGREAAASLRAAGASLLLVGRSAAKLAAQARVLPSVSGATDSVTWHAADLTRPDDITALAGVARQWGCNVVVHNAGVPSFGSLESVRLDDMVRVLDTNLKAPILLTQALLPHFRTLDCAQVICIGSVLGRLGLPGYSVYSASKFGLRGFAEALRRELNDTGIAVQYLGPRSTRTGFNSDAATAYNQATGTGSDTPEAVAAALLGMLEDAAPERFLGFPERFAVRLNGFAPTVLDGAFGKHRAFLSPTAPAA